MSSANNIFFANVKAPCKDCPSREVGCHGSCEKYRDYSEVMRAEREKRHAKTEEYDFIRDVKREVWRRHRKRRKGDDR